MRKFIYKLKYILFYPILIIGNLSEKLSDATVKRRKEIYKYNIEILKMSEDEAFKRSMKFDYIPPLKILYPILICIFLIYLHLISN